MSDWSIVKEVIRKSEPQMRENARLSLELERRMVKAGIPLPRRAPILTALYDHFGLLSDVAAKDGRPA